MQTVTNIITTGRHWFFTLKWHLAWLKYISLNNSLVKISQFLRLSFTPHIMYVFFLRRSVNKNNFRDWRPSREELTPRHPLHPRLLLPFPVLHEIGVPVCGIGGRRPPLLLLAAPGLRHFSDLATTSRQSRNGKIKNTTYRLKKSTSSWKREKLRKHGTD